MEDAPGSRHSPSWQDPGGVASPALAVHEVLRRHRGVEKAAVGEVRKSGTDGDLSDFHGHLGNPINLRLSRIFGLLLQTLEDADSLLHHRAKSFYFRGAVSCRAKGIPDLFRRQL